jgi:hypothetical protein
MGNGVDRGIGRAPDRDDRPGVSPGLVNAMTLIVAGMMLGVFWRELLGLTVWALAGLTPPG